MGTEGPGETARELFLRDDNTYGCAEAAMLALERHFLVPDGTDGRAAMALNGGIAYSGATCGAITGVALAVGKLAGERAPDRAQAKAASRAVVQAVMAEFAAEFGATDCRTLTGYDLSVDHDEFISDGAWRKDCMRQIEFSLERAVHRLKALGIV
jgi:C_GCAxxG_C_C family probable redox protein